MADLSPVREASPPAPRPTSPALVPAEETTPLISTSTAAAADDETTPLLSTGTSAPPDTPAAVMFASKAVYVLTTLALTFSAAALVLIGTTFIVAQIILPANGDHLPYRISDLLGRETFLTIVSICICSLNISRQRSNRGPPSLAINLLFDLILSYYIIIVSLEGLVEVVFFRDNHCYCPGKDPRACCQRRLPIVVLAVLAVAAALLVGVSHLILFVIRCFAAYRTKFWRRPWRFPTGQLTLEFTVKLLREPQREVVEGVV